MGNKDDAYYMRKALEEIDAIVEYSSGKTYEDITRDHQLIDAVMFRLIQLIEHIKGISAGFKNAHLEVPWGEIIGFRNGIVHEYGRTDFTTVYEIINSDVYVLKDLFERSLEK